jgi:hypothetical protein
MGLNSGDAAITVLLYLAQNLPLENSDRCEGPKLDGLTHIPLYADGSPFWEEQETYRNQQNSRFVKDWQIHCYKILEYIKIEVFWDVMSYQILSS